MEVRVSVRNLSKAIMRTMSSSGRVPVRVDTSSKSTLHTSCTSSSFLSAHFSLSTRDRRSAILFYVCVTCLPPSICKTDEEGGRCMHIFKTGREKCSLQLLVHDIHARA